MPAPPKSSKKPDPESEAESDPYSGQKESRLRIPSGIRNDRITVHQPWIVLRHVDYIGIGRLDDDGVALIFYLLLFIAIQVTVLVSLLPQRLDGVGHILLLIGICVAKR